MLHHGVRLQVPKTLDHPGVRKVGRLIVPRLFGSGVYQLSVFVDTFCASLSSVVGVGGISAIYYANRILQFPMSIFGVAIASAILPTLSGFAAGKDFEEFRRTLIFALKSILLVMMPIAVFLVLFATPIIRLLFERGAFDAYSTAITAQALLFFALGLFWFAGAKVLVTAFHSLQDTATPAKVAALCLVVNVALNFILMGPLKVGGIALASAISSGINFFVLLSILSDRLKGFGDGLLEYSSKIFLSSIVMGAVCFLLWHYLAIAQEFVRLIIVAVIGAIIFFQMCAIFRIHQAQRILAWILKRP